MDPYGPQWLSLRSQLKTVEILSNPSPLGHWLILSSNHWGEGLFCKFRAPQWVSGLGWAVGMEQHLTENQRWFRWLAFSINFLLLFWVAGIWWCLKSVFHKKDVFFSLLRQGCFNSLLVLWRFQGIFGFCTLASWPSIISLLGVVSQGKWICKALLHLPSYEAVGRFIDFHDFTAVFLLLP